MNCLDGGSNKRELYISWVEYEAPKGISYSGNLDANQWAIGRIVNDNQNPNLIDPSEIGTIFVQLEYEIFPGGIVRIVMSSDNGVTSSSIATT